MAYRNQDNVAGPEMANSSIYGDFLQNFLQLTTFRLKLRSEFYFVDRSKFGFFLHAAALFRQNTPGWISLMTGPQHPTSVSQISPGGVIRSVFGQSVSLEHDGRCGSLCDEEAFPEGRNLCVGWRETVRCLMHTSMYSRRLPESCPRYNKKKLTVAKEYL